MFTQYFADLVDKLVILSSCFIVFFFQNDFNSSVFPLLMAVIISGFLSFFDDPRIRVTLIVCFLLLSCFMPGLIIFLPLIAYDTFCKFLFLGVFYIVPIVILAQNVSIQLVFIVAILSVLSIMVKYHVEQKNNLREKYNRLTDETREMSIQLKKQNKELIENQDNQLNVATLNERTRIAREIHDNVGHLLSRAILQSGALLMINHDEKLKTHLEILKDTLSQAMDSIRSSVHDLYDESFDLNAQIGEIVQQFTFCDISYEYYFYTNPNKKLKYTLVSIIKEALSNIIKHSNANQASVILREHPALYQLIIQDNGTVNNYNIEDGMGLVNMADRIHSFSGNINITTENGFRIFISIPKEGE